MNGSKGIALGKKSLRKSFVYAVITFSCVFLYCGLFVWQGLDMSDEGHHLINQIVLTNGLSQSSFHLWWFTDIVGGKWLEVTEAFGLVGARFGWVLVQAMTALFAFLIMNQYSSPNVSFIVVALTAGCVNYRGTMVINYNGFPALLMVLVLSLLSFALYHLKNVRLRYLLSSASGLVLGIAVVSRLTLLPCLVLPLGMAALYSGCIRGYNREIWFLGMVASVVSTITVMCFFLFLYSKNVFDNFLVDTIAVVKNPDPLHEFNRLFELVQRHAVLVITRGIVLLSLAIIFVIGFKFISSLSKYDLIVRRCGYFLFGVIFSVVVYNYGSYEFWASWLGICFYIIVFLSAWMWFGGYWDDRYVQLYTILASSVFISLVFAFASGNGLRRMIFMGWVFYPLCILMVMELVHKCSFLENFDVRKYAFLVMISLSICGFLSRFNNPYRDHPNRFKLTRSFNERRLRWIFTTEERARSVNELLEYIGSEVKKDEHILCYPSIPIIYFASATLPVLSTPSPSRISQKQLKSELENIIEEDKLPRFVVRSIANPTRKLWPIEHKNLKDGFIKRNVECIDKYLLPYYAEDWRNAEFIVYRRRHATVSGNESLNRIGGRLSARTLGNDGKISQIPSVL